MSILWATIYKVPLCPKCVGCPSLSQRKALLRVVAIAASKPKDQYLVFIQVAKITNVADPDTISRLHNMETLFRLPSEVRCFEDDFYQSQNLWGGDQDIYGNLEIPFEDGDVFSSIPLMFGDMPYPTNPPQTQSFEDIYLSQYCTWDSHDPSSMPILPLEEASFLPSHAPTLHNPTPELQPQPSIEIEAAITTRPAKRKKTPKSSKAEEPSMSVMPQILKFQVFPSSIPTTTPSASSSSTKPLLSVFDSAVEPKSKRKFRSEFTEEGKKKVDAVRAVGACIQCKFRKRTVRIISSFFTIGEADAREVWNKPSVSVLQETYWEHSHGY